MFLDNDLMFSNAQAVTAAAASTNVVDLGPLGGSPTANTGRDIGVSDLYIFLSVDTTMTDSGSNSVVDVTIQTDTDEAFGSALTVATLFQIPALSVAGTKWFFKMPPETTVPYERYIRLLYTPPAGTGDLSAGAFSAGIIKDIDKYKSYQSATSTGI